MFKTKYLIIALTLCASGVLVAADETAKELRYRVSIGDGSGYYTVASQLCRIRISPDNTMAFIKHCGAFLPLGKFKDMNTDGFSHFLRRTKSRNDFIHFTIQNTGDAEKDGSMAIIYDTGDINDAPRLEAQLAAEIAAKKATEPSA